jgi:hydrogenase expression/formation protein HypD
MANMLSTLERFRNRELAARILREIRRLDPNRRVKFMHVCGSHELTITRFGLRSLLPDWLEVISGPGCPICVTSAVEIDEAIELARRGNLITTFGDMFRAPSTRGSLANAKTNGADVSIVYGISDAVKAARNNPRREVVHVAIGFETTAPTTAAEVLRGLPENFSLLVCHRLMPPVMQFLLASGETALDGFICPGHVSTIIGSKPYEPLSKRYKVPQVIAGFEPVDVLIAIWMLLKQLKEGRSEVEIEYTRSVRPEGNVQAQRMMEEAFEPVDKRWRGFPVIPKSALELRSEFECHDARKRFAIDFSRETSADFVKGCRCGEVLRGLIYPQECPMFDKACTPEHPLGPCAVTTEGACNAAMKHKKFDPVIRFKKFSPKKVENNPDLVFKGKSL